MRVRMARASSVTCTSSSSHLHSGEGEGRGGRRGGEEGGEGKKEGRGGQTYISRALYRQVPLKHFTFTKVALVQDRPQCVHYWWQQTVQLDSV